MANSKVRDLFYFIHKRSLQTSTTLPTAAATNTTSSSSFTVHCLVNSCGLTLQCALSASQKLQIHEARLQNPQSVIECLKSHHFSYTHIAKLIEKKPSVLHSRVESNLKPKFDFLIKNGFVGRFLPELIISNPEILGYALDSRIKPSMELLKSILGSSKTIVTLLKRFSWLLTSLKMQRNVDFLIKEGVPVDNVAKLIVFQPRVIIQNQDRMVYAVNAVKNLSFEPKTAIFIHALRVMIQMSKSTWKKKIEVKKSLGRTEEDILWVYKRFPMFFACSEEKIRSGMDFYVNTMKLGLQTIVGHPKLLHYSIDKRVRPRHNVLKVLESQKPIKGEGKIVRLLEVSEKNFLENYIAKYVEKVPGLLEIYRGTDMVKKIQE